MFHTRARHGAAQAARELSDAQVLRDELGAQRHHLPDWQLSRQREQQGLGLCEIISASEHVDADDGAPLQRGLKELQQPHGTAQHALGLQK